MPLTSADLDAYARVVHDAWWNKNQNVMILTKPGLGSTLIPQRAYKLLDPVGPRIERRLAGIYGAAGLQPPLDRPFRAPHHTTSELGVFGNGKRPGEFELASYGVLFLEELQEFHAKVIERLARMKTQPFYLVASVDADFTHKSIVKNVNQTLFKDGLVINLLTGVVSDRQVVGGYKEQVGPRLVPVGDERIVPDPPSPEPEPTAAARRPRPRPTPGPGGPATVQLTARERERARWMVEEVRWYDNYEDAIDNVLRQRAKNRDPRGLMGLRLPRRGR